MTIAEIAASVAVPVPPEAFHPGEQALQARVGVRERMAAVGAMVLRDHMPDQHRELFEKLPTLLLGALDGQGQPWATMLAGPPGFVHTPMRSACASPPRRIPRTRCLHTWRLARPWACWGWSRTPGDATA